MFLSLLSFLYSKIKPGRGCSFFNRLRISSAVDRFFISGSFPFQITDSLFMVSGILAGELSGGDILKVNFSTLKLNIDEPDPFSVTMGKMMLGHKQYRCIK